MHGRDCKQYTSRSYNASTFNTISFDEFFFTYQCEKGDKNAEEFQISQFYWLFSSDVMTVKGLKHTHAVSRSWTCRRCRSLAQCRTGWRGRKVPGADRSVSTWQTWTGKTSTRRAGFRRREGCRRFLYTFSAVSRLSLIHIWRCRRHVVCRSRWSPYH